jgi:ribosome biogenesis GTPase / thiamine phosphate phosphatase
MPKGLIMRSAGLWYDLRDEKGVIRKARIRGKMKLKGAKMTNPLAVGDWVEFEFEDEIENKAIISQLIERKNCMMRQSPHRTAQIHALAANLDQAVMIATLAMPRTSFGFIDRFLASAEAYDIPAVLIFNKIDLLDDDSIEYLNEVVQMYENIGYQGLCISALNDGNLLEVRELFKGKTTLILGHSGVGKSTLLNRILPQLRQTTAPISDFSEKGTHTTTFAEMFEIDSTTFLIDTPGINEWGVVEDIGGAELSHFFPEMRAVLSQCRYPNCTHSHEPACKVREAVEKGKISMTRYHNYLSILHKEDTRA